MYRIRLIVEWLDQSLLSFSGARPDVLQMEPFWGERAKYRALGSTVLLSSVLVGFSAGYGVFLVSASTATASIFALIMGLIYLNLEKVLMHVFDRRTRSLAATALLMVSIFTGIAFTFVISDQLELALFAHEIDARLPNNAASSLLDRLAVLRELKSTYPEVLWGSVFNKLLCLCIFNCPILIRWLLPVSAAYQSYLRYEEEETVQNIEAGTINVSMLGPRSEEIVAALDDASQTAERIISSLDESHEVIRRVFAYQAEKNV
jgi:hypothetical protein